MNQDVDEVYSIIDAFGVMNIDDEQMSSMKRGDLASLGEEFADILVIDESSCSKLKQIESILLKHANSDQESYFWAALREQNINPCILEALCFMVLGKVSDIYDEGIILYSILLGMEPCSSIWNPTLFKPILSSLISTQQLLETGAQANQKTKEQLELTITILNNLQAAINEPFINMIGFEVFLALNEISMKLMIGFRVELDKFNEAISIASIKFATKIASVKYNYLLPFLTSALLLQFAANTTSITSKLERIRDKIADFTTKILKPDDEHLILICKHMIMRAPEKSHLRKAVAQTIFKLAKHSDNFKEIIRFTIASANTGKIGTRSFASHLIQLYLNNVSEITRFYNENDITETIIELSQGLKKNLSDSAPTVRSIGLEGIAQLLENIDSNPYGAVILNVIDNSGYLETILSKRITDEKLIVRRSTLTCINQIVANHSAEISPSILEMISSRTRDRAVSIRQLAIRSLNMALKIYPQNIELHKTWLNSVLPLIVDPENTVQNEALDSITENFFGPLIDNKKEFFTSIMCQHHFDFMKNVFTLYKQKAISLNKISKALYKRLSDDSENSMPFWIMTEILANIELAHFKTKDFTKLWKDRSKLPPEYFLILTQMKIVKPKIKTDLLHIIDYELQNNARRFKLMHSVILLLSNQENSAELWPDLLYSCCTYINNTTQNSDANEKDLYDLLSTIYTIGELIITSNPKILFNYDFVGLQLLIAEVLPNGAPIPSPIRALSVVSLGKLCIIRKDVSTSFVSAFAHLLSHSNTDPSVKCNCLIVLCDLCVHYTALVDPHIKMMSNCFADESNIVRHQTLHVMTRLIVEDYYKIRPQLYFKYLYALSDPDKKTSEFAQCCLFNVIYAKAPEILTAYFIDAIYYFSGEINMPTLVESAEEKERFKIVDSERRKSMYFMVISKLNEMSAFNMIQTLCNNVLKKFVDEQFNIYNHKTILEDSIYALIELEDKMKQAMESEVTSEDAVTDKIVDTVAKMINEIHNNMIQHVLPILNEMHRILRDLHSPLQMQLKMFYKRVCQKNPNLLKQLEKTEPFLAVELRHEMELDPSNEETTEVSTPIINNPPPQFASPLLSNIASTPRSALCSPLPKSPTGKVTNQSNFVLSQEFNSAEDEPAI